MTLATIFVVIALVCFVLSAFGVAGGRVNLVALGLACLTASMLVGARVFAIGS